MRVRKVPEREREGNLNFKKKLGIEKKVSVGFPFFTYLSVGKEENQKRFDYKLRVLSIGTRNIAPSTMREMILKCGDESQPLNEKK